MFFPVNASVKYYTWVTYPSSNNVTVDNITFVDYLNKPEFADELMDVKFYVAALKHPMRVLQPSTTECNLVQPSTT